jgi:hypothetical protein
VGFNCGGKEHRLTLTTEKELTIHDHTGTEIESEEIMAALADTPGSACPCVKTKLWLPKGIYVLEMIP